MNELKNIDQTQFSFEEPIFSDVNVDLPVEEKPVTQLQKKNSKRKFIIIGLILFFVLLLLILLIIVVVKSRKKTVVEVFEEEQVEVSKDLGPFETRIKNARLDLDFADPANQDLTFPPVDMGFRLDKKEK